MLDSTYFSLIARLGPPVAAGHMRVPTYGQDLGDLLDIGIIEPSGPILPFFMVCSLLDLMSNKFQEYSFFKSFDFILEHYVVYYRVNVDLMDSQYLSLRRGSPA